MEWSSKRFAQANKRQKDLDDCESAPYYERDWRYTRWENVTRFINCVSDISVGYRNDNIRREAVEERQRALVSKIENQLFHQRTAVAPTLLQLHPFDQQIAVAGNDSFA